MSGSFTFLHAADLHIDSPLRGLSNYADAPAEELRLAVRDSFVHLVELAIERRVRFVILAGDLFDGDWKDYNSGLWFAARMRELAVAEIEVFVVRGNHDADSKMSRRLDQPKNVHVFAEGEAETVVREEWGVALHGQSYEDAATKTNLAVGFPTALEGLFNIGVLHTALQGREGHGTYAPCTVDDLRAKSYDYWALGHVHQRETVSEDPWIVFPGNIQGRNVRETGAKGASIVTVLDGEVQSVEHVSCDVVRWRRLEIELSDIDDEGALMLRIHDELSTALKEADARFLAARVVLTGATELDRKLRLDEARIQANVRAQGSEVSSDIWIEKVLFETSPTTAAVESSAEWAQLFGSLVAADFSDEELGDLAKGFSKLSDRLPAAVREAINPADREHLQSHLEPARRYLSALLSGMDAEAGATQDEEEGA